MKVLAVQVANGFSPEARVLASLLGHSPSMDVRVLHHDWPGDHESANRFAKAARASVMRCDFGWRPPPQPLPRKILARAQLLLAERSAVNLTQQYRPDVIVSSQQVWDCTVATSLSSKLHIPQVVQLHYSVGWWLGKLPLARLKTCDLVIAISDFIAEQAIAHGVPRQRITTIKNTAVLPAPDLTARDDVRMELGIPANACIVGFVARLDPFKGHTEAIDAFARVARSRPDLHILIAGRGELEAELKMQASTTAVSERIHFVGYRTDVPRLLAAMDIFVHPSYNEPFGLAVLEAQAAGLPVVAFRSGATAEVVCDGETALLSAEGNIDELAELLAQLADDAEVRTRMGTLARERVQREFSPVAAGVQFETVLRNLIRK
ncbi:MAG: glycosyltransferase family 4 protein [Chloroflexi bacterium]|nr:glycosyltransferase family 4 protein [Chloroflexota bacterium]MBV9893805.1 glycosyltransferase family 4 protein [Chloroflexota bacterium]